MQLVINKYDGTTDTIPFLQNFNIVNGFIMGLYPDGSIVGIPVGAVKQFTAGADIGLKTVENKSSSNAQVEGASVIQLT